MARSPALRAIVLYKSLKAALELGAALLLGALWPLGLPEKIASAAGWLRHHLAHGWANQLAALLVEDTTRHRLALSLAALSLDGALTAVEAWSLRVGYWWGPWLVVLATTSLLPFEIYEFVQVPRPSRAVLIAVNLLVAAYLARRAGAERR
ncbi:MAG TPA: DUF2127 domain-containing protein [Polyangiaceae bacterium]|nr:DUF2127 domain-containing protein [Polyangiaceae bacterium]